MDLIESGREQPPSGNGTDEKFLLFSQTRCGSTTLCRLLNCHSRISCLEEPFNPYNYGGQYSKRATDAVSLDDVLQDIWRTNKGIKHTWDRTGWPFLDPTLNTRLLLKPNQKIIYLRRRNLLQRLVSIHISHDSEIWGLFDERDRKRLSSHNFHPMNLTTAKSNLDCDLRMLSFYKLALVNSRSLFMDLCYEDLYGPGLEIRDRVEMLNRIISFLGEDPMAKGDVRARVNALFNSRTMKLNSVQTYRRIPGIMALEEQCGSDETGWLFKD